MSESWRLFGMQLVGRALHHTHDGRSVAHVDLADLGFVKLQDDKDLNLNFSDRFNFMVTTDKPSRPIQKFLTKLSFDEFLVKQGSGFMAMTNRHVRMERQLHALAAYGRTWRRR